ncbi:hypothetical protein FB565_003561 [Actinoplanes lutulentus]|uniref:Uncharacterized protein n=1 Tax=Actinoplanes lutulentus TaxID=1287878 RepID=A0A327Z7Q6_9ACTN|nr:hypothetical protein [Actinoplanes lutulentus]MBB2943832.1 hypothetical protein [Actinoplanes lutulentus]RAK29374.1 hypothetical protein B0I29_118166 [Actinoplanes lutulentus]
MSRVRYRAQRSPWLSRRRVLALAATGVGVSAVSVAGLSLAGENGDDKEKGKPLVLSLRDANKGTFDVFSGEKRLTITDKKLAAQLLKAAGR